MILIICEIIRWIQTIGGPAAPQTSMQYRGLRAADPCHYPLHTGKVRALRALQKLKIVTLIFFRSPQGPIKTENHDFNKLRHPKF